MVIMVVLKNRWIIIIMGSVVITALVLLTVLLVLRDTSAVDQESESPVELLQRYLRINTTTGSDLTPALEFWQCLADDAGVDMAVHYYAADLPVIVLKWPGSVSSASSIMLNSHMDVVPAEEDDGWTYPPFDAILADDGKIYGRGTQDMKSVSIQYYLALKGLMDDNETLLRTVYMTLMPDEEVGGENGMIPFLRSDEFAAMKVGFEMDEGSSFDLPIVPLFYQDKVVWQIQVDCYGEATHGSTFADTNTTATGKCYNVMTRMFEFREEQYQISLTASIENAGTYTSANLNRMNAGTANNVVPSLVSLVYDIRLSTTVNEKDFEAQLKQIIAESGSGIELTFISKNQQSPATVVDNDNPYWLAVANAAKELNLYVLPVVPAGSTDARHVRNAGIPAFGFSPMPNTTMLLHAVDEYVDAQIFLQGIHIYKKITRNLANIPVDQTSSDPSVYLAVTTDA